MKPEDRKRLKEHIEMIVEHKEPDEIVRENFKKLQDEVADLREKNIKLRLELSTLRFKESQEQRFIWWVREVYAKKVMDTIVSIRDACTYTSEKAKRANTFSLPVRCWNAFENIMESTNGIYDGTYLDVEIYAHTDIVDEISTGVKSGIPENKPAYNENANSLLRSAWMIANRNGEQTNWEAFKNAVYKELVEEHNVKNTNHDYYNHAKTSSDNNKCWWTQESDPEVFPNLWRAGCGNSFYLDAEKPSDNHMKYCCYCGKEIAEG